MYPVSHPYAARGSGLFDVTEGTNVDRGDQPCQARSGWDGPSGWFPGRRLGSVSGSARDRPGKVNNQAHGTPVSGAAVTLKDTTRDALGAVLEFLLHGGRQSGPRRSRPGVRGRRQ